MEMPEVLHMHSHTQMMGPVPYSLRNPVRHYHRTSQGFCDLCYIRDVRWVELKWLQHCVACLTGCSP